MTPMVSLTQDQFEALLSRLGGSKDDRIEEIRLQAQLNAEANKKLLRPENERHPGEGVYSRPGGELKNPKGELGFKLLWCNTPEDINVLTAEEFDLAKELQPGEFTCTKSDGSRFKVTITTETNPATGAVTRKLVQFDTKGSNRHNLPSKVAMCRELIAQAKATSARRA